ncbi:hypothetical protein D3C86_2237060 [compost metagenome]
MSFSAASPSGLLRKSSMPAARVLSSSSFATLAVQAMIGTGARPWAASWLRIACASA